MVPRAPRRDQHTSTEFHMLDVNNDGMLTKNEYIAYFDRERGAHARRWLAGLLFTLCTWSFVKSIPRKLPLRDWPKALLSRVSCCRSGHRRRRR